MISQTRSDAVHLESGGYEAGPLLAVGTISGVVIRAVAQRNGRGAGRLVAGVDTVTGAATLAWQAPGSGTPGAPQPLEYANDYLLEDGEDTSKWIRIAAYPGYLATSGQARVFLKDGYNTLGPQDVGAGDAAAGQVVDTTYQLKNRSTHLVTNVRLWIDAAVSGLEVSADGISFFTPTSELDPNVLAWASIAAGASVDVTVRRTIAASAASDPARLNVIHFAWTGQ